MPLKPVPMDNVAKIYYNLGLETVPLGSQLAQLRGVDTGKNLPWAAALKEGHTFVLEL